MTLFLSFLVTPAILSVEADADDRSLSFQAEREGISGGEMVVGENLSVETRRTNE